MNDVFVRSSFVANEGDARGSMTDGRVTFRVALAPASPLESVGWYLSLYWPAMQKEFKGIVQRYDADSKHHTVRWDNAPRGSDGVTEVDLSEGELTWLKPPEKAGAKKSAKSSSKSDVKVSRLKVTKVYDESETMEDLEARFIGKTTKAVAFQVLKNSGPQGMSLQEIVDESQKLGLRDWTTCKQPKTTINVCVSQDPAFVKIAPGRVGLRVNGAEAPSDASYAAKAAAKANGNAMKKRGRPPKDGKSKKARHEPQHWERKPPIDLVLEVTSDDGKFISNSPMEVPFNITIKALKRAISANTKGALKPQYQQIFHESRNIGNDEDAFLVHAVRPSKFERSLHLKLVIGET